MRDSSRDFEESATDFLIARMRFVDADLSASRPKVEGFLRNTVNDRFPLRH